MDFFHLSSVSALSLSIHILPREDFEVGVNTPLITLGLGDMTM